jgi:hypothetical protein
MTTPADGRGATRKRTFAGDFFEDKRRLTSIR